MSGQGSGGNILAALCSFFIPGLGQLLQGRLKMASIMFGVSLINWTVLFPLLGFGIAQIALASSPSSPLILVSVPIACSLALIGHIAIGIWSTINAARFQANGS